jgi:hypothetical protein
MRLSAGKNPGSKIFVFDPGLTPVERIEFGGTRRPRRSLWKKER